MFPRPYQTPEQAIGRIGRAVGGFFGGLAKRWWNAPPSGLSPEQSVAQPMGAFKQWYGYGTPEQSPYYQVGPTDASLDQVAKANGIPLEQLVTANNGMKTLPPSGSYIQTRPVQAALNPFGAGHAYYPPAAPQAGLYSPGRGGLISQAQTRAQISALNNTVDAFEKSYQAFNDTAAYTGKLDTKILPQQMSIDAVKQMINSGYFSSWVDQNGSPMAPVQIMGQLGYKVSGNTYVQTGTPVTQGGPGPGQAGYSRGAWVLARTRSGALKWKLGGGSRWGGEAAAPVPEEATNAGGTPVTTLDIHQASG